MSLAAYNKEFSETNYDFLFASERRFVQAKEYLENHGMESRYENTLNMKAAMAETELGADSYEAKAYSRLTHYDKNMVEGYKSILFRSGWGK